MISIKDYRFAYKGLGNGIHNFDFEIDSTFFSKFEKSRIKGGNFTVDVEMDKRDTMFVFQFDINGSYKDQCDRCTAPIDIEVSGTDQIIIKFADEDQKDEEEIFFIDPKSTHIDLTEILYELIHVLMPITARRDCEADDYKYCDHDALDKLEGNIDTDQNDGNPLWSGLKDLNL